jgi:hypothetical protein
MACFLAPAAEAVVTTIVKKRADKKGIDNENHPFLSKLGRLNTMLWGGSALLAFEHVWHGEVTPWFPFLTNAANPADAAVMLREIATSGVAMAALVTVAWMGSVIAEKSIEKRSVSEIGTIGGAR